MNGKCIMLSRVEVLKLVNPVQHIGDEFLAFTSASCRFLKEVHAGDTLYPQLEIIKLTTQGDTGIVTTRATVHNQRGELVLDGEHTYSLKAASADEK